jgi:hypothetical protein
VTEAGGRAGDGSGRDPGAPALSFLGRRLPPAFGVRVVTVGPGESLDYDPADWRDALVVVERGELRLTSPDGAGCTVRAGDVLCLAGLALRMVRNPGREPAVLTAVARRGR